MTTRVVVIMGVSGVGKTTLARGIAARTRWAFAEGDDLHPPANRDAMRSGRPLEDADRWPWLALIRDWMAERVAADESAVVTCSALRRAYRDLLRQAGPPVRFLHLVADEGLVADRLGRREGHFMPAALSASQFDTLEELAADELATDSAIVSAAGSASRVLDRAMAALDLLDPGTPVTGAGRGGGR